MGEIISDTINPHNFRIKLQKYFGVSFVMFEN